MTFGFITLEAPAELDALPLAQREPLRAALMEAFHKQTGHHLLISVPESEHTGCHIARLLEIAHDLARAGLTATADRVILRARVLAEELGGGWRGVDEYLRFRKQTELEEMGDSFDRRWEAGGDDGGGLGDDDASRAELATLAAMRIQRDEARQDEGRCPVMADPVAEPARANGDGR
jgi:hypothetical protein